jgi:chemotaxis protein methyltransferase CheR
VIPPAVPDGMRLRPDEFRLVRDLVSAHAGIYFGDEALSIVERRLRERVDALGLGSFGEYYRFLRLSTGGEAELGEVLELLTTNETYFFREAYQLRALRDEVLPEIVRTKSQKILSVWSAGCSTGEEAYTLAIVIAQSRLFDGWQVRVYGSDISRRCVAAARRGVYGQSAFRVTPPEVRCSSFVDQPDGIRVADRIRAVCHFGHLNLMDAERVKLIGRVDVVFCRNVLIYFDQRSRKRVIDMLYDRLLPGGLLFLGHSESLLNVSTAFELVHLREDLAYRRPIEAGFCSTGGGP